MSLCRLPLFKSSSNAAMDVKASSEPETMPLQSTGLFAACPILPQRLLHIVPVHLLQQAACCIEVCCDALFELRHRPAAITAIKFTSCQPCLGLVAVDTRTTAITRTMACGVHPHINWSRCIDSPGCVAQHVAALERQRVHVLVLRHGRAEAQDGPLRLPLCQRRQKP